MREIVWSERAASEYRNALAYLVPRNPDAAVRLADNVDATIRSLAETPSGRRGRVPGTFEKVLQSFPYIIAYELDGDRRNERLIVLGVIHAKRNWTRDRWPAVE